MDQFRAFYSDPHFGHKNIIEYCKRPFASADQMDGRLISNYNAFINKDDIVLWLGDCFFGPLEYMQSILQELNGKKILVRGGHDGSRTKMLKAGFMAVMDYCYVQVAGHTCLASHYPYKGTLHLKGHRVEEYPNACPLKKPDEVLIHGHTHSYTRLQGSMIHVGVEAWDYYPALIEQIDGLVRQIYEHPRRAKS